MFVLSGKEMDIRFVAGEKEGLYPIQALVQPIALRFKYHFEGARQTNKLEKVRKSFRLCFQYLTLAQPEWYFTHVQNVSHEHAPFLSTFVQKLLEKSEYGKISAWVCVMHDIPRSSMF